LVILRDSLVEHKGIDLVLFFDKVLVDLKGDIRIMKERDFDAIREPAWSVNDLPNTNRFRNQWRMQHGRTGRPIDRILYPEGKFQERDKGRNIKRPTFMDSTNN